MPKDLFSHHGAHLFLYRSLVREMTQKDDKVLVLSYSRRVLGQTGDGHFSPVGGYHPERDLVLILDTARFKYPPHWVSLRLIWDAMLAHDKSTGRSGDMRAASRESLSLTQSNLYSHRRCLEA